MTPWTIERKKQSEFRLDIFFLKLNDEEKILMAFWGAKIEIQGLYAYKSCFQILDS